MRVRVLFFGALREITGRSEDELEFDTGACLGTVFEHYAVAFPRLREMERSIALARNQLFSRASECITDGDEIAFLPPVSGGATPWIYQITEEPGGHFFALTREPIDTRALAGQVLRGEDGAVVTFEGIVRNNTQAAAHSTSTMSAMKRWP